MSNRIEIPYGKREDLFSIKTPEIELTNKLWTGFEYDGMIIARLCYDETALHVGFTVYEDSIRAVNTEMNSRVCDDSCVEFFFMPAPESDPYYFNFEMNPLGTLLIGRMRKRGDGDKIQRESDSIFSIHTSVTPRNLEKYNGPCWQVSYSIPYSFILKHCPDARLGKGAHIRANFYKCGDQTPVAHYISWNNIDHPTPEFHLSRCFGDIYFN